MNLMQNEIIFMFSGQGSQYFRMGKEYYDQLPAFREQMNYLDEIVIDKLGISVIDTLYTQTHKPQEQFNQILLTHPGLFMIQYSIASSLIREGIQPNYLLGCSLGECVSLAVSGILPTEEILDILIEQAILFQDRSCNGGMIAILDNPSLFYNNRTLFGDCEIAGLNFPKHFCISGNEQDLEIAEYHLRKANTIYERLPIKQPFHSKQIDPLKDDFVNTFKKSHFSHARIPTISCMSTKSVNKYCAETIWDVVRKPILFEETIKSISVKKHNTKHTNISYVDLGPSGTLSNFIKYNLSNEQYKSTYSMMSPFGNDLAKYHHVISKLTEIMYSEGA